MHEALTLCPALKVECGHKESCLRYRLDPQSGPQETAFRTWDFSPTIKVISTPTMSYPKCDFHTPLGHIEAEKLRPHGAMVKPPAEVA